MIVHLAGAPGSGKSTLAKQVQKAGWLIYDLDDLNIQFVEGNNLIVLTRSNPKRVIELYQEHVSQLVDQARQSGKHILFVGINAGLLGSPPGSNLIDLQADYNVFLNVDTDLNAKRWIQRDMPEVLDEFVKSLKDDIKIYSKLEKEEAKVVRQYKQWFAGIMRDFRPSQRKDDIRRFKKFYDRQGYTFMTPPEFNAWFFEL